MRNTPHGGVQVPDIGRDVRPCPDLNVIVDAEKDVLGECNIHDVLDGDGTFSILLREELSQLFNLCAALLPHSIGDSTSKCFDPVVVRLCTVGRSLFLEPLIRPRCFVRKPAAKPTCQFVRCLFVVHVKLLRCAMSAFGRKRTLAPDPASALPQCPLWASKAHHRQGVEWMTLELIERQLQKKPMETSVREFGAHVAQQLAWQARSEQAPGDIDQVCTPERLD